MVDYKSDGAFWGFTEVSAADLARFFLHQETLIPRRFEGYARWLLSTIEPSESWGIPRSPAPSSKCSSRVAGSPKAKDSSTRWRAWNIGGSCSLWPCLRSTTRRWPTASKPSKASQGACSADPTRQENGVPSARRRPKQTRARQRARGGASPVWTPVAVSGPPMGARDPPGELARVLLPTRAEMAALALTAVLVQVLWATKLPFPFLVPRSTLLPSSARALPP